MAEVYPYCISCSCWRVTHIGQSYPSLAHNKPLWSDARDGVMAAGRAKGIQAEAKPQHARESADHKSMPWKVTGMLKWPNPAGGGLAERLLWRHSCAVQRGELGGEPGMGRPPGISRRR